MRFSYTRNLRKNASFKMIRNNSGDWQVKKGNSSMLKSIPDWKCQNCYIPSLNLRFNASLLLAVSCSLPVQAPNVWESMHKWAPLNNEVLIVMANKIFGRKSNHDGLSFTLYIYKVIITITRNHPSHLPRFWVCT